MEPRCDGNIVEMYCELLEGEGESERNIVNISVMRSIYELVFVYLVKRFAQLLFNCVFVTI